MADLNKVRIQVLDPATGRVIENVDVKTSDAAVYLPDGTNLRSWINDSEEIHAEVQKLLSEHLMTKHVDANKVDDVVTGIDYDDTTGKFTITNHNGTKEEIDTLLEKLAVNFDLVDGDGIDGFDAGDKLLEVTLDDGTKKYADLSSLIDVYTGETNDQIDVNVDGGKVSATIVDGGVTTTKIADGAITRAKIDTAFEQQIKSLEASIGVGGSVTNQIDDAIGKLDAEVSQEAGVDGLSLKVTEEDGKITAIEGAIATGTYDAYGSAKAVQGETEETVASVDIKITELTTASTITVEKLADAESGFIASYVVKQGGTAVGDKINIPKDYLVKSAQLKTAEAEIKSGDDVVVAAGNKYIDFVVNTKEGVGEESHIYLDVTTLVDVYGVVDGASDVQLALDTSTNKFSATLVDGGITYDKLDEALKAKVDYTYTLEAATKESLGGVIAGNGISITENGTISTENVKVDGVASTINMVKGIDGAISITNPVSSTVYTTVGTPVSSQTIVATATGAAASATLKFQWFKKLVGTDVAFTQIVGATTATLDAANIAVASKGTTMYYCVVSTEDADVDPAASKKITVVVA